jgi:hypothetical protein
MSSLVTPNKLKTLSLGALGANEQPGHAASFKTVSQSLSRKVNEELGASEPAAQEAQP